MNEEDSADIPLDDEHALAAIDFQSPGRFTLHNPPDQRPQPAAWEPAPFVLGAEQALQRFSLAEQARAHALALLQQARRSLCLYSPDLEPWLYHHSSVQQACSRFLLGSPNNRLRILVKDARRAVREGHRLVTLSRRLSSNLQIRRCHPDYPDVDGAFLLADEQGLLLRPEPAQFAGYAKYSDPARVRQLRRQFDQAWDTSITDPDLRSFLL
ncbi:DUF7931 domain-containing protein [Phytopseudomonas dryadis]|uniref:Histone acetyltransferase HPA2 n=1 Tax=Phytopseudomonas dryadis TaxID=2487520 RepID=A0A4Q9R9R0_9GAMM|nr:MULTISPECIES: histone acetyltransferase HPA2 [Pseudomonas]TBU97450.1 histone acetyltransferase HPA2 [Pseudomonas dryadis]TBV09922.1 histone acetyltransferase HPA2 [Pseudomonas dryadis]TBV15565.1 histone acetyltransferase HPA2 [Pseudomonas sp. FRB 230]